MSGDIKALEAELSALTAERARKAQERAEASKAANLAAEIAKQKRLAEDDETFAKLQAQYGELGRIDTKDGMVCVVAPEPIVYNRFRDEMARSDHPNPKQRISFAVACDKMAENCVVYPARDVFRGLANKYATLTTTVVTLAMDLGKTQAEDDVEK